MTQEDERIARKLLDLSSRGDRVQLRNGMTYLDGYALGNGTVELRSQVVRDRRMRMRAEEELKLNAFVLYSVITGAIREFWVKSAGFDVKVHEIPLEIEVQAGWKCVDGVCSYSETEGVYATQAECESSRNPSYQHEKSITGGCVPWVVYRLTIEITATVRAQLSSGAWSEFNYQGTLTTLRAGGPIRVNGALGSSFNSPFLEFWRPPNSARLLRPVVDTGNGTEFQGLTRLATGLNTGLAGGWFNVEISESSVSVTAVRDDGGPDSCGELEIPPENKGDIIGYTCGSLPTSPLTTPNPYEAFLSYSKPKVFTLIKSNLNDEDEEFGELKYQSLVGETLTDLGTTADPEDWRGEAVVLTPTTEIEATQPCTNDYLASNNALLKDGTLYTIDLTQDIGGQTLRSRLQSSTDTVVATMITRAATNAEGSGSCALGNVQTSKIQVPSPGRGEVLGIAVEI